MPPSRGLESGTGVVRLDKGRDVSWPELIRLEMLPVLKLFWLGLEVETEWSDLVGEEVTPALHLLHPSEQAVLMSVVVCGGGGHLVQVLAGPGQARPLGQHGFGLSLELSNPLSCGLVQPSVCLNWELVL